ncbi:hypothetical protein BJX65DRAFT_274442 [Aspergillus insuetus]
MSCWTNSRRECEAAALAFISCVHLVGLSQIRRGAQTSQSPLSGSSAVSVDVLWRLVLFLGKAIHFTINRPRGVENSHPC